MEGGLAGHNHSEKKRSLEEVVVQQVWLWQSMPEL